MSDDRHPGKTVGGGVRMAGSSAAEGVPGESTEPYRPPSGRAKLIIIIVAVLVVTNVVTGLTVYYAAQPPVAAAPLCGTGGTVQSAALATSVEVGVSVEAASGFTVHFAPPYKTTQATITLIGPWAGGEFDHFKPVLENFTTSTGIPVTYQQMRQEQLQQVLPADFATQTAPGDVIFMISSFIKANGPQHMLKVNANISDSDFLPGSLDPVKVGTDIYGGVYTGKVKPGFWYRKSFFQAHNLTIPTTYDQFKNLLVTISKIKGIRTPIVSGDSVGWPLSDVTEHFIATYGGASMHRALTNGSKHWTDSDVRAVFANRLVPLLAGGCFSEPLEWNTVALANWWGGLHALYFMGSWITGLVDNVTDLGVFSLPPPTGTTTGIVFGGDYFFVPKYTTHQTEALILLKYLASKDGQTIQVKQGGHIATALGVPLSDYPAVDRGVAQLMNGVDILSDLDDTIGGTFQTNFWSQLQLLWVSPNQLDSVLASIQSKMPAS